MLQFGFNNFTGIMNYLGVQELNYDVVLIDIDSNETFSTFEMMTAELNYFVTAFDNYSLKRGLEIIGTMQQKIGMKKILFSRDMLEEENDYLDFLSFYYSIMWHEGKIFFPYEKGDNTVHIENQRAATIRFKELTQEYKDGIFAIVQEIDNGINVNEVKKLLKNF